MTASADVVMSGLREPLSQLGVDVESVDVQQAGRRHVVRVVVDRDGGVDLDLIAEVSRVASDLLDTPPLSDALPGPFVLEVTSPGVDRPLTEPRHWRRAVSRLVHVFLIDGTECEGRLTAVPSEAAAIVRTDSGDVEIAFTDVKTAVVQVEFNRADHDTPSDGVDDDPETGS